jgi:type III restriction enzyme
VPTGTGGDQETPLSAGATVEGDEGPELEPVTWTLAGDEDTQGEGQGELFFAESDDRKQAPAPKPVGRVKDAPQVRFPVRQSQLTYGQFTLSDISDYDAQQAGARFIAEVPTFLHRDALEAQRKGEEVSIRVSPQELTEAEQTLAGIDTVRAELAAAIFRHSGVEQTRSEKNAAKRVVEAFLRGAGVTTATETAEWGENRRLQAVSGMSELVTLAYADRPRISRYKLVPAVLPVEPVLLDPNALDAYSDKFQRHVQIGGWKRCIMPTASFDAESTEFAIAHILDRDPAISWWLRLDVAGPAYVQSTAGRYFPDFIAVATDGTQWLIEGKADARVRDEEVQTKKKTAEDWARYVRDNGEFGTWRYMFASESQVRAAAGSWQGLIVATNPEA